MRPPRRAIAAVVSVSLGLAMGAAVAHADASSTLYVNSASANCSDTAVGAGSAATPYCTIQAAADAAVPGDTVAISAGEYPGGTDIRSSGTADAPIVFKASGGYVDIGPSASGGPALSFDGASYVTLEGSGGLGPVEPQRLGTFPVRVNGSSHITLDSVLATAPPKSTGIEVTGSSSDISVTRDWVTGKGNGVAVDSGSAGDVVSTNVIESLGQAITVDGASGTSITSNTVHSDSSSDGAIDVFGGSSATSVENNIVSDLTVSGQPSGGAITVDASSAPSTTLDYNVVWPVQGTASAPLEPAYAWAGVDYSTQATLTKATGQGVHDLVADPEFTTEVTTFSPTAPEINSANSAAPGMLGTDEGGNPCHADPTVPITGAGTPAYCMRGAVQEDFVPTVQASAMPVAMLGVKLDSSVSVDAPKEGYFPASPTPAISYVIDWGDGSTSGPIQGSATDVETAATHAYAKAGIYTISDTAKLTDGTTTSTTTTFTTAGSTYTPLGPQRILDTRNGVGTPVVKVTAGYSITVAVAGVGGVPFDATAVALNVTVTDATGNGYLTVVPAGDTAAVSNLNYGAGQTVSNSVIVPLDQGDITIYNSGAGGSVDVIADLSGYFAPGAGNGYAATRLDRLLDTRNGTGAAKAKVAANTGIPVTIAGADSIPAGVAAVALHVTVVDTTGNGWIAAQPDAPGTPSTSALNYGPGQIVSNTVIVPVAADGRIELYNGGGTTPVDLIADVSGYFSTGSSAVYVPVDPTRAVDSRTGAAPLPANRTQPYQLGKLGFPSMLDVIANVTLTQEISNGFITVYPSGTAVPATSNLNYAPNQTIGGMFILSTPANSEIDVYNQSHGTAQIIIDVFGYFTNS